MEECKIIILIFACDTVEKYRNQIIAINETWGKKCEEYSDIQIVYSLGEEITENSLCHQNNQSNIKYIYIDGVENGYESASYKQWIGMKYVYEHYKCDFVFCIGTDTYLNIPKLRRFVDKFNPTNDYYIGGHGCHRQIGNKYYYYHSGGSGFIITHPVLKKLYPFLPYLMDHWKHVCKTNFVDYLSVACDVGISYYTNHPEMGCQCVKDDLAFKSCNYKGWPCHMNQVDMTQIVSCHFMGLDDFREFTEILEKNNYFM